MTSSFRSAVAEEHQVAWSKSEANTPWPLLTLSSYCPLIALEHIPISLMIDHWKLWWPFARKQVHKPEFLSHFSRNCIFETQRGERRIVTAETPNFVFMSTSSSRIGWWELCSCLPWSSFPATTVGVCHSILELVPSPSSATPKHLWSHPATKI